MGYTSPYTLTQIDEYLCLHILSHFKISNDEELSVYPEFSLHFLFLTFRVSRLTLP